MTDHSNTDRILALSGVYMAIDLMQQIAHHGQIHQPTHHNFETLIKSIFKIDADNVVDVYQSTINVLPGIKCLCRETEYSEAYHLEQTKYVITLLHLEKKLSNNSRMLTKLSDGIENIKQQVEHFSYTHNNVIASLADLYKQTISTLSPRIMVNGESLHLENPDNANKIRALLLAGIRSAVLWRQCGGSRLHIFFRHKTLLTQAAQLAKSLEQTQE